VFSQNLKTKVANHQYRAQAEAATRTIKAPVTTATDHRATKVQDRAITKAEEDKEPFEK
jgi:hypothetical protein